MILLISLPTRRMKILQRKNSFLVNREFRMNLYAVKAMLARVYCYKGDAESKGLARSMLKR